MSALSKGWTTVALGDVTSKTSKWDPRSSGKLIDYIYIASIDTDAKRIVSTKQVHGADAPSRARQLVHTNDVLVSTVRPNLNGVSLVPPNLDGATASTGFSVLRATPDLEPRFLGHWVSTRDFVSQLVQQASGQSYPAVSDKIVRETKLPLPPLNEQRRIAAILDKASHVAALRKNAQKELDRVVVASFVRIFGPPSSWAELWPMGTIGDLAETVQYGTSAKAGSTGNYKVLRMGNITMEGHLNLDDLKYIDLAEEDVSKYTTQKGDLLFNRTNSVEQVGKTGFVDTDEPFAIAGYLVRLRLAEDNAPEYVATYLNSQYGRRLRRIAAKSAVNQANINATQLKKFPIPHPSRLKQREFQEVVAQIATERSRRQTAAQHMSQLATSLQSRAFRGEL